ncbi:phosphotransferase [Micromonospora sp. NPDC049891]|uniref:phosphotransferase family protein n=1 Tax=Micromonospora sp. NPDC049891 TaxID=3155655 RepID=UPI0033FA8F25
MFASKKRPRWAELPASVRGSIEGLLGGAVAYAESCAGGFSPGFASRLTLHGGHRAFVKAVDAHHWPIEASHHRAEADVAGRLPAGLPVPRLLDVCDDGRWVILAFEQVDGVAPGKPWTAPQIRRVVAQAVDFAQAATPSPIELPRDHPRLGGWAGLALDQPTSARLRTVSAWAPHPLGRLTALEREGLRAAQGDSLVHCDLYPHNVLVGDDRVVFVDWPHARLGAPVIDLVALLTGVAADGVDPEPYLLPVLPALNCSPASFDAILAAHTGFLMAGALAPMPIGLEAIAE